jgi:hypothetical protein
MTFAEPYILLSQLHWGHHYGDNPIESAKQMLNELVEMRSAKREFFTNLGLLIYTTERESAFFRVVFFLCGVVVVGHGSGTLQP